MNLYLVRHSEALAVGGQVTRDADRPLTPRGEQDAALIGWALARIDTNVEMVVTSPLARAVETGEIIGKEISNKPILFTSNNLAPGFEFRLLLDELVALGGRGSIVAVGHQPDLSNFVCYLIADSAHAAVSMPSGAIAKIVLQHDVSRKEASLHWLLTPDIVKSLYPQP